MSAQDTTTARPPPRWTTTASSAGAVSPPSTTDELTETESGLLQARSRRLLADLIRPHKRG